MFIKPSLFNDIHFFITTLLYFFPRKNHRPFRDDDSLFSLPAFKECLVRQVRFVSVRLGQQVAGSVHGQHGLSLIHI